MGSLQQHHLGEGREQPRAAHVAHTHGRANATIAKAGGGSGTGGGCTCCSAVACTKETMRRRSKADGCHCKCCEIHRSKCGNRVSAHRRSDAEATPGLLEQLRRAPRPPPLRPTANAAPPHSPPPRAKPPSPNWRPSWRPAPRAPTPLDRRTCTACHVQSANAAAKTQHVHDAVAGYGELRVRHHAP